MENIKSNYLKEVSIQEELRKVKIENYLEFFGDGRYEFYKCSGCFGPQLGHITQKCIKLKYEKETVQDFEIYLKEIGGFKEAIWRREEEIREKKEKIRAKEMVEAARAVESNTTAAAGTTGGGVTQLVKPRLPPLWTGQKFDRWKAEVISWRNHGRGNDKEKIRAKEMVEAARAVESNTTAAAGTTGGGVTQLVKPRPPPLWTGQKFDR